MKYKTIGILGGMGPEATAELYLRIVRIFQQEFGAKYDNDFPEIVILNLPLPDVVETVDNEKVVREQLLYATNKLELAGVDFIAIPCNTAMLFLDQTKVSVPLISIVEETKKVIGKRKVGILGTKATIRNQLYGGAFVPSLKSQERITKVIINILSGKKLQIDKEFLCSEIQNFLDLGADKVILGCTELPLLISTENTFDTLEILARAVVREATNINEEQLVGDTP